MKSEFYTLKGYQINQKSSITEAMEDYIEMIYRLTEGKREITIKELSEKLNVKPSSTSKMATRLKEMNFITFEKYGKLFLTKKGIELGKYYLYRHNTLKDFLMLINQKQYHLKQVEQIEHYIDKFTIQNIHNFMHKKN